MRGRLLCKYSNSIKKINLIFAKKKLQILSLVLESLCQIMQVCAQWLKIEIHSLTWRYFVKSIWYSTIDLWKSWFHGIFWEKNPLKQISDVLTLCKGMYKIISWKWWGLEFTKSFSKVVCIKYELSNEKSLCSDFCYFPPSWRQEGNLTKK